MQTKKILFIPIILIIISITTSIIAFRQSEKLELGNLYVNNNEVTVIYDGEYFAVIGNIDYDAHYILAESLSDYLKITTYDINENIQKEFSVIVKAENEGYSSSIVSSVVSNNKVIIDEMEDYLFKVNLETNEIYTLELSRLDDNPDINDINVVLVNIPENIFNLKTLMESVAFTTLVFAIISIVTIIAIYFIKK